MKLNRNSSPLPAIGDRGSLTIESELRQFELSVEATVAAQLRKRVVLDVARPYLENQPSFLDFNSRAAATFKVASASGLRVYSGRVQAVSETRAVFIPTQAALRLQRRRDFRLTLARTVSIERFSRDGKSRLSASLLDLSGGGAQVEVGTRLSVGEIVDFSAPMGSFGEEEMVAAVVLSCQEEPAQRKQGYVARLSFDDDGGRVSLAESRRDEIVRYLFACQREQLKLRSLLMPAEGRATTRPRGLSALLAKVRGAI